MSDDFKVNDTRRFNADGSEKESTNETPDSGPAVDAEQTIDFNTFILSLASSVQISLGVVANPMTGETNTNLAHAKQTIDILGMLEEKTQNNLSPEESGLLKNILFQLRMQYVDVQKQA